jgi:hypothetical protein
MGQTMNTYEHVRHSVSRGRERHYLVRKGSGLKNNVVVAEFTSEWMARSVMEELEELARLRVNQTTNITQWAAE